MGRGVIWFLFAAVVLALSGMPPAAAEEAPAALPRVLPVPRHMAHAGDGAPGWLEPGVIRGISATPDCRAALGGIERLAERLREPGSGGNALPPVEFNADAALKPGFVHLGLEPNAAIEPHVAFLPKPQAEGYRLVVDGDAVYLLGNGSPGLYHGLTTLRQLVDSRGRIARVAVSDWPDFPLRGVYMAGSDGLEARILRCAELKFNFMLFECGDFFNLEDDTKRARWQEAFALCRKHFIEPVPELQSLGWGQFVLEAHPEAAEGVYVEGRRFEVADGAVQSPSPPPPPDASVANAGLDNANGGAVEGWTAEPGDVAVDTDGAHAGAGSLRVTRSEKGVTRVWQDVAVQPRHDYELALFMKTKGVTPGTAYGEVYGLNPDGGLGAWMGQAGMLRGDQDWQRMALAFNSGDHARVRVYLRIQDAAGTAWFDAVSLAGLPGANPLGNVLISEAAPVVVRDASDTVTCEEGRDYRLVPAPAAYPFSGTAAPLGIEILPGGRLAGADAVLLSYHQAPPDSITCCPSEPLYQEFMRDTIRRVMEALKPACLHIGHDEPRVLNRDRRCTARGLSNSELFADDIARMRAFAREADPGVRVMMWSDAVNPHHNGPSLGMNDAAALLPKDIIQCLWWYDWPDTKKRIENSAEFFLGLGVDVTGSPWFDHRNVKQWADTLKARRAESAHVLGPIYTTWSDTTEDPWQALETAAQFSWITDKVSLEEFLNGRTP